jgi:hypothetical protein
MLAFGETIKFGPMNHARLLGRIETTIQRGPMGLLGFAVGNYEVKILKTRHSA